MTISLHELAAYLGSRQGIIIDRWARACRSDDKLEVVSKLTRDEFRNNLPAALEGFCRVLMVGGDEELMDTIRSEVAKHGHHRWKQGFSLRELIRDWGHLNRVLISMIEEYFATCEPGAGSHKNIAFDRLAVFLVEATSGSVRRFDNLRRAEAASLEEDLKCTKEQFEQFKQTQRQLLREAAHDLRGGLSAIAGASSVLKITQSSDQSISEMIAVLEQGISSVTHMLNSLLDLSKLESGTDNVELSQVNIADVLNTMVKEYKAMAASKGLTLVSDGPEELVVQTDPEKVHRIAQNLIVNALKYTQEGEIRLSWKKEPKRWLLLVRDTGPGMQDIVGSPVAQEMNKPDSSREQSFVTGPHGYKGEGIGLTIVKRLCDLLDAGISMESKLGAGTLFTVQFPLEYDHP